MERALSEGRHSLDSVVDSVFTEAKKGNVPAVKEIRETLDGKAPVSGEIGVTAAQVDLSEIPKDELLAIARKLAGLQ